MLLTQKDKSEDELTAGFGILSDKTCEVCGTKLVMNMDHDTMYCPKCNVWTESKCNDPKCNYCKNRPEKPIWKL